MGEIKHFKFGVLIDVDEYYRMHDELLRRECVQRHVTSSHFGNR